MTNDSRTTALLESAKACGLEDLALTFVMLGRATRNILPKDKALDKENIYTIGDGDAVSNSIWYTLEMKRMMRETEFPAVIERPVMKSAVDASLVADVMMSILAWEWLREDARPDATPLLSEEVHNHPLYPTLRSEVKELIGYQEGHGFGTSRLLFGPCQRDCTKCPLSNPLGCNEKRLIVAERVRCPMFSTRLAAMYDPIFSIIDPSTIIAANMFFSNMSLHEELFMLVSKDVHLYHRLGTIKRTFDQFSPISEDRMSWLGAFAGIGKGWEQLTSEGPRAPWRGISERL